MSQSIRSSRYSQLALFTIAAGVIYPMLYLLQNYEMTIVDVFKISNRELARLYSLLGTVFVVTYLPSGWLADRMSPKILVSFSLLSTGLLGLWYASIPSYHSLLIIFACFGITTGLTFWGALLKKVRMLGNEQNIGFFFGALEAGRGLVEALLASVTAALFAQMCLKNQNNKALALQSIIEIYAFSCLLIGVIVLLIPEKKASIPHSDIVHSGSNIKISQTFTDMITLFRIPKLWLMILIIFCGYQIIWSTYSFSAYLQSDAIGISAVYASIIVTFKLWMRPIASIGGGFLGDKFSRPLLLAILFFLVSICMFALIQLNANSSHFMMTLIIILTGFFAYTIRSLYWSLMEDCKVPLRITGLAYGFVSLLALTPDIFMPVLKDYFIEKFHGIDGYKFYYLYIIIMAICGSLSAITLYYLKESKSLINQNSSAIS